MPTEAASRVVAAVHDDEQLRASLFAADSPEARRQILEDRGLLAGFTDGDFESLRALAGDQQALNQEILRKVSGGNNTTEASDINGPGYLIPTSNAGGATIAGDVIAGASTAVVSTATGVASAAVAIGGAAFGF